MTPQEHDYHRAAVANAYFEGRERERKEIVNRLLEAEKIDREHGFTLPGDSALYICLWGMEQPTDAPSDMAGTT